MAKKIAKKLSPIHQSKLSRHIADLKRAGAGGVTLVQARIDYHEKYGLDAQELNDGFISITDNDYIISDSKKEKEIEREDYIEDRKQEIDDYFSAPPEERAELDSRIKKISKLDYLSHKVDKLERKRSGLDEDL